MSNWFYNEVEMMNKHKMLKGSGFKHHRSKLAREGGRPGFVRRSLILLGQALVNAGKGLLDRYETMPANDAFLQPSSPD